MFQLWVREEIRFNNHLINDIPQLCPHIVQCGHRSWSTPGWVVRVAWSCGIVKIFFKLIFSDYPEPLTGRSQHWLEEIRLLGWKNNDLEKSFAQVTQKSVVKPMITPISLNNGEVTTKSNLQSFFWHLSRETNSVVFNALKCTFKSKELHFLSSS